MSRTDSHVILHILFSKILNRLSALLDDVRVGLIIVVYSLDFVFLERVLDLRSLNKAYIYIYVLSIYSKTYVPMYT